MTTQTHAEPGSRDGRAEPGSRDGIATSARQDAWWYLDRLMPGSPAHRLARAYDVAGALDLAALDTAWRAVVGRHDILRTTLATQAGRPAARIGDGEAAALTVAGPGQPVERFLADAAARPLDPARGPLARLTVAPIEPGRHCVLLEAHRIVADDPSMATLVRELFAGYAVAAAGFAPAVALPGPAPQFAAYAAALDDAAPAPGTVVPPSFSLPFDRDRPAGCDTRAGEVRFDWGEGVSRALLRFAGTANTLPWIVVLTAWLLTLARYGGEERVAAALPVSLRRADTPAALVGPLDNCVVVDVDLSGDPSFRTAVRRVTAAARGALDARDVPFGRLVRASEVHRDPRRIPLCDVGFTVIDHPPSTFTLPGARAHHLELPPAGALADLTMRLGRRTPVVDGRVEFRSALFDATSVDRIAGQAGTLLAAALDAPDTPAAALPLDEPERVRAALREFDAVAAAVPADRPVHELVELTARTVPEATAVSWQGAGVSYARLWRRARGIAAVLAARGATGRAVAVRVAPGPEQIAALVGVLAAGAHVSWMGTGDPGERGRAVLTDLRPACVLVDAERADDELARWLSSTSDGAVVTLPPAGEPAGDAPPVALADRAYVAHTSGSTGRPKGVAQPHAAFGQFVCWLGARFAMRPGARVAQWVAPEHDPALCEVFAALAGGATLCPVPPEVRVHGERLVDWLAAERITHLQTVPSFARELLRVFEDRGAPDTLRHLMLMGEALPGELAGALRRVLPGTVLSNLYGPTETVAATWHELGAASPGTVPVGRPIPGRQVLVLDGDDRPCPAGVIGAVVIRSPYVCDGYLDPGAGRAFAAPRLRAYGVPDGRFYRTGDLGRVRFDGALEYCGREDFQVKLYGMRLELTEVEAALTAHESVRECAVVATGGPDGLVNRLTAYVVPARPGEGSPDAWRSHLRRHLGKAALPIVFSAVPGPLPRNVGGKIDRARLATLPAARHATRPAGTAVERELAALFARVLDIDAARIGTDTTLYAAGGDSLHVPVVLHRIRQRFGVDVPAWDFCADPTVAGLARLIGADRRPPARPGP